MIKGRDLRNFALGAIIVASGLSVWAAVSIPNTFVAGTVIKSAEVNANFTALKTFVDALEANKQNLVSGTCAAGSSIRAIATDGTVTCQTDNVGGGSFSFGASVSGNSAGPGLKVLVTGGLATAIYGESTTTGTGVLGKSAGGQGVYGWAVAGGDGVFGTASSGNGVSGNASGDSGTAGKFSNSPTTNTAPALDVSTNGSGVAAKFYSRSGTNILEASAFDGSNVNLRFRVSSAGSVFADGAYSGAGADVAEFVPTSESIAPSDVVEIGPDGQFRLSRTASSTAVAGVITTRPGVLMNANEQRQTIKDGPALALAGRVPVKVSAENGAINPGDLLVASGTPGHAMRAPSNPAAGTVIGKALGRLGAGTGRVEMLVMLR